jgi:hypothetical protein
MMVFSQYNSHNLYVIFNVSISVMILQIITTSLKNIIYNLKNLYISKYKSNKINQNNII